MIKAPAPGVSAYRSDSQKMGRRFSAGSFREDELRLVPFWILALLPVLRLYQIEFEDEYEYEFEGVGKSWG
jgi:hypothetical protein